MAKKHHTGDLQENRQGMVWVLPNLPESMSHTLNMCLRWAVLGQTVLLQLRMGLGLWGWSRVGLVQRERGLGGMNL